MTAILSHRLPGCGAGLAAFGGGPTPADLDRGMWDMHRAGLRGPPDAWRSDPGLRLLAPANAEDAHHVPILADATGLGRVERIVVTIDYSPFPLALVFHPGRTLPLLGFGVKYEIAGPIRAYALTGAEWIMGGALIDAMGGCSAPAATHARPDWQDGFGEMRARLWPDTGRLRVGSVTRWIPAWPMASLPIT